ncbi:RNA polymerase sigma factor [Brevibacillus reuszeri]|uniref:RNA polymerase sigma factor n=1 Tax=Brevibacillus reuszeri TaxID=54915 RepID=UPI000CCC7F8E|nr:sigma-70 family RNA polymerase sigma factor [Brevibacillus reuszeri]
MEKKELEQAIKEVKAGDIDQFGVIIDIMQKPLFVYCYHMLGHRQEAEDAVQEVFLKAYEQIDSYRSVVSFSAWLYKIAYHHCLNLLKRARLGRIVTFWKTGIPTFSRHEGEERIDREYLNNPLHLALLKLSASERNLIILRVVEDKGYDELSIQQSSEWKRQLMDVVEGDFDVKDQVLQKLYERKKQREAISVKKRIGLIVAATLVLGGTTAFAAMKVYELKNDQGEAVVRVSETAEPEVDFTGDRAEIMNQIRATLQPGARVAVYIAGPDNPDKNVSFMEIPLIMTEQSELQKKVGSFFEIPQELVGGYKFVEGDINHQLNEDASAFFDEMVKDAERDNKKVLVRDLPANPKLQYLYLTYKASKGEVYVNLTNFENMKWVSDEARPNETVEKVTVQNKEALYHVRKLNDKESKFVQVYQDDKKRLIEVRTTAPDITKEDLLKIAEKL